MEDRQEADSEEHDMDDHQYALALAGPGLVP
jgi:hypothetical protein